MADIPRALKRTITKLAAELRGDPASTRFVPLADALSRAGRFGDAARVCHKGLTHHPDHGDGLVALARALFGDGELDGAEKVLERRLQLGKTNPEAYRLLGEVLLCAGRAGEVETLVRRAAGHGVSGPALRRLAERAEAELLDRTRRDPRDHDEVDATLPVRPGQGALWDEIGSAWDRRLRRVQQPELTPTPTPAPVEVKLAPLTDPSPPKPSSPPAARPASNPNDDERRGPTPRAPGGPTRRPTPPAGGLHLEAPSPDPDATAPAWPNLPTPEDRDDGESAPTRHFVRQSLPPDDGPDEVGDLTRPLVDTATEELTPDDLDETDGPARLDTAPTEQADALHSEPLEGGATDQAGEPNVGPLELVSTDQVGELNVEPLELVSTDRVGELNIEPLELVSTDRVRDIDEPHSLNLLELTPTAPDSEDATVRLDRVDLEPEDNEVTIEPADPSDDLDDAPTIEPADPWDDLDDAPTIEPADRPDSEPIIEPAARPVGAPGHEPPATEVLSATPTFEPLPAAAPPPRRRATALVVLLALVALLGFGWLGYNAFGLLYPDLSDDTVDAPK